MFCVTSAARHCDMKKPGRYMDCLDDGDAWHEKVSSPSWFIHDEAPHTT